MKSLFVFLLAMLLSATAMSAQEYKVYGTFSDPEGNPMPGVTVMLRNANRGTQTNFEGYYELTVPEGEQVLVYRFLAPDALEKRIDVSGDMRLDINLEEEDILLDEVLVSAIRANPENPVTFSNLTAEEIKPRNLGQDIPILMNYMPAVVTTSDAGAGVGYTGIRVRGSDATRVNVTINGIPYNDAESHGTFWVNMPDFATSVENLQLQRGVGTSTNGAGAFGASLNLLTDGVKDEAYAQVNGSAGSFNTLRTNIKFGTGLMNDHFSVSGRLSRIQSDGYIDRASSDLESYFLQAAYKDENTLVKALLFGGHEITYQAWYGIEDEELLRTNRTFNIAGAIYGDNGEIVDFYDNEVDNYKQDHFQLHWNQEFGQHWNTNLAVHYTYGRGFFEQFRQDDDFATYGLEPLTVNGSLVNTTDLIRRRWLDNDFYGTTFSAIYEQNNFELILGGAYNIYEGDHFGEIIWARFASDSEYRDRYYNDDSRKTDLNTYAKVNMKLTDGLSLYGDLQFRKVNYEANGEDTGLVDDEFNFLNPKVGLTYRMNASNQLYLSYARGSREPNRNDYESGSPKPEFLNDYELGWRFYNQKLRINANAYYMRYKDQLVLTGALNDVGAPLRENVGDSYRLGLELDASLMLGSNFVWQPNLALSSNKNIDYIFSRDGELVNLGNTNISYSPEVVAGNVITWLPGERTQISVLTKYVSEQYLGNIDAPSSKLDAYTTTDLNLQYEIRPEGFIRSVVFSGLLNNVFDAKYISNGYYYTFDIPDGNNGVTTLDGTGYYPQAGINFLLGASISF
ncbi:TonB-dependent receptor [Robertkochia aurantiaca]|uniref:TonB-dependent receptor n=1 Tax=Robertkochia aurantiaca TaxID=2873700 RepID=UPI001CCE2DC5|nr:TonB-dependent receptor [Robertkochia sp. 3YJGBD-33]